MIAAISWHISRSSGLLAWALLALATIWGLVLSSRVLERRPSPAWLLDLHRYLGTLTLLLAVVHVGAVVADGFVDYSIAEALIPLASDADTAAVALGVTGLWLLVGVQLSSWSRSRLAPSTWRRLHYLSAPLLVIGGVHGVLIGTDIDHPVVVVVGFVLSAEVLLLLVLRVRFGRRPIPSRAFGLDR